MFDEMQCENMDSVVDLYANHWRQPKSLIFDFLTSPTVSELPLEPWF
jgi:hypothetical protein